MEIISNASKRMLAVVTFKDVHDEIMAVNPELCKLIEEISPDDDYKFVKASYLYGDIIIKNGVAQFPDKEGRLIALDDAAIHEKVRKELFPIFQMLSSFS